MRAGARLIGQGYPNQVPIVDYAYSGPLLDAATEAICPNEAQCPDVSISRLEQVLEPG